MIKYPDLSHRWVGFLLPPGLPFIALNLVKLYYASIAIGVSTRWGHLANLIFLMTTASLVGFFCSARKHLIGLAIISLVISVVLLIDILHYRFFAEIASVTEFRQAFILGIFGGGVSSLVKLSDLLLFIDVPLFIYFYALLGAAPSRHIMPCKFLRNTLILAGYCSVSIFLVLNHFEHSKTTFDDRSSSLIAPRLGLLGWHLLDVGFSIQDFVQRGVISQDELEMVVNHFENEPLTSNPSAITNRAIPSGLAKGSNLLVIQVESLQAFVIELTVKGSEVTPNLSRLKRESLYFNNFFSQASIGATSDAEFSVLNSLLPTRRGATVYHHANNEYFALPRLLQEHGYETLVMVPCTRSVWNQDRMDRKYGFGRRLYSEFFKGNGIDKEVAYDDEMYQLALPLIEQSRQPFFLFMITASSHTPFSHFNKDLAPFDCGDVGSMTVCDYLKAIHYADASLGEFIDKIRSSPLGMNTTIVIYGDHEGVSMAQRIEAGLSVNGIDALVRGRVPLIISLPVDRLLQHDFESLGGQIDLGPTILDLLGYSHLSVRYLGSSLLAPEKEHIVVFRSGDFVSEDYFYSRTKNSVQAISEVSGILDPTSIQFLLQKANETIEISDILLDYNLVHAPPASDQN